MAQSSVLVVEDDIDNFNYIKEIIDITKLKVIHAKNGSEAVKFYKQHKNNIRLILMDIRMPVMNGFLATKEIKKINKNIPVVAQTACVLPEDEKLCMDSGCDEYIEKPFTVDTIINIVKKHLS